MNRIVTGIALSLALAGCSNPAGLQDGRHATGSSTLVASSDYASVYAVNTEAGTVARYAPRGSTAVDQVEVGAEPTRIARAGERVFVTLRAERAVAVLAETPAGLQVVDQVEVGAEPYGVVASEDGSKVYVAVSHAHRVVELDAKSLAELRSWNVPKEPRYVALHPSGEALYVGSGNGEALLTRIDLTEDAPTSGEVAGEPIAIPDVFRFDENFEQVRLTPRITGDLAISPDGLEVVVPVIYVDNVTPVGAPEEGEEVPVQDGYGSVTEGVGRFNPAVAVVPVGQVGEVTGQIEAVFISGNRIDDEAGDVIRIRSYPSSVTVSPDNTTYLITVQGSQTVSVVGALPFDTNNGFRGGFDEPAMADAAPGFEGSFTPVLEAGFAERPKALVHTEGLFGPSGVVFLEEGDAYVHSTFDRKVANLDYGVVFEDVRTNGLNGFDDISFASTVSLSPELGDLGDMPQDAARGREFFFGSTNRSMVASGAGVSCASCHFEGRNDGLTWSFVSGDRQTPSLAGPVSLTAPVTWTSDVDSVATEAQLTTELRMGGHSDDFNPNVAAPDYAAIAAYVEWTRHVDVPDKGANTDAVARGRVLFERADVGCASCHSGSVFTDNGHHAMFGLSGVNTPTLVGIAASAPYLHDGRATDLRAVLDWSRSGEMGDTSMLSEAEMSDLEAYLRSL